MSENHCSMAGAKGGAASSSASSLLVPKVEPGLGTLRLASFHRTQDLSRGMKIPASIPASLLHPGTSNPRRVFTPNIPTKREKLETGNTGRSDRSRGRGDQRGRAGRGGRGRGRGRGNSNLMQIKGLWGDGCASVAVRNSSGGASSFGGGVAAPGGGGGGGLKRSCVGGGGGGGGSSRADDAVMQRPVVTGESLTVDKGEEDEAMAQMVCDNFIEHEDDGDDYAHQFCEPMCLALKQVKLEVSAASSSLPQQKEVPSDTKIKVEPDESPHLSNGHASGLINGVEAATTVDDKTSVPMTPANRAAATTAGDVLSQDKNTMLLFQLPQTLPSIVSGEGSHARLQPGTSSALDTEEEEGKKKAEYCRLRDLPSGQIGCVKIYKSGRAELCLGNYALPINVGCQQDFLQEVAHVSIDETRKSGKMAVLGRVDRRLLVSPSFSSLLESSRSKR